jgi:RNA polymerase sigma factor (sigma-70 family)
MSAVEALPNTSSPSQPNPAARDALHLLYEQHYRRILGFCRRRLNSREEAEDAVQSVFVNALQALQRGVVPTSEEAWLVTIARNVCHETHRANNRRRLQEVSADDDLPDAVGRDHEAGEVARELLSALGDLPDNQRRALLLREWRGLSYREIATDLRCSVGAVETLIFRARRNVAQALTQTRARVAGVLDFGWLSGAIQSASNGATAKIAAAAAVVTMAALPAGDAPPSATERVIVPSRVTQSLAPEADPRAEAGAREDKRLADTPRGKAKGSPSRSSKPATARGASPPTGASGGAPAAPAAPAPGQTPPAPVITPPTVQVPPPAVQVPQVPHLPQLPREIQLPELPPDVPVPAPTQVVLPQLP